MAVDISNNPRRHRVIEVNLNSEHGISFAVYGAAKGWSPSTRRRREPFLPVYEVPGIPGKMIVPARAEAVLRGEPLERVRPRRGRGRPPKGAVR